MSIDPRIIRFSAFGGRPYRKAQEKLTRVLLGWIVRELALWAVAVTTMLLAPPSPPPWVLALTTSSLFTSAVIIAWPDRQVRQRLKRLDKLAAKIDRRRAAEGYLVIAASAFENEAWK